MLMISPFSASVNRDKNNNRNFITKRDESKSVVAADHFH